MGWVGRIVLAASAGVCSVIALAVQVKPEDAASNLSAWYKITIGALTQISPPSWLTNPAADSWVTAIAGAFALICLAGFWVSLQRKRSIAQDLELIGVRSDANRLVRMLIDVDDLRPHREEFETVLQRIEKSPSAAWRNAVLAKNREEFANACRATYSHRAEWGRYPGWDGQYFEQLIGAQRKLADSITG